MKKYSIKESFYTVQGEGFHAGTPALFIRLSGCNMWTGLEQHRARDAARNHAECPKWCDTDFANGTMMDGVGLAQIVDGTFPKDVPLVVLTGGEPLLQVDAELIAVVRSIAPGAEIAVETNGTVVPKVPHGTRYGIDWICVSPKQHPDRLKLAHGNELKVVYPAYDPRVFAEYRKGFGHAYVSAEATTTAVGQSLISKTNLQNAAAFVMQEPGWKLTTQGHKVWGLP